MARFKVLDHLITSPSHTRRILLQGLRGLHRGERATLSISSYIVLSSVLEKIRLERRAGREMVSVNPDRRDNCS